MRSGAVLRTYHCPRPHVRLRMRTAVKHCIVCGKLSMKQDRYTHGQNKVALNSTSSFAVRVECANTHDLIELRLNCNDRRGENERWMMHAGRGV